MRGQLQRSVKMARVLQIVSVVLFVLSVLSTKAQAGLSVTSECICQGYNATFECSVMGPGSTVWRGSGFRNCSNNRISLFHSQFSDGVIGTCNNGAIVGHSIGVENSSYTSQLDVFVSPDLIGTNISCSYDNGLNEFDRGNLTIILTTVPLQPPTNVTLSNATSMQLIFAWDPVISNCPAMKYNIITTNCGNCPSNTRSNNVTCLNPQPQPNAGLTCTFTVRTETCEGVISGDSEIVTANLKVPDVPVVKIVPTYSQREGILTSLHITIMELPPFSISDGIDGSTTLYYTINYSNLTSGEVCGSAIIPGSSCMDSVCIDVFNVTSSRCFPSTELSVTIFASNVLGDGETSEAYTYNDINTFVDVNYNMVTKRFTCTFMNRQDNSEKSCTIVLYRDCQQQQSITAQVNSTNSEIILVPNGLQTETSIYCYVVVARNDTVTLNINGTIGQKTESPTTNTGAIAGGVIGAIAFIAIFALVLVAIGLIIMRRRKFNDNKPELELIKDDNRFIRLNVDKDCELKTFIEESGCTFHRGAAFFEFTRAEEDIEDDKEVILMDKNTQKLYNGKAARNRIKAPGKGIKKPELELYRVFVQSKGIGFRPLRSNSLVLYESNPVNRDADIPFDYIPIDSNRHFQKFDVPMDCELREFIERHCKQTYKSGCAFAEFKSEKRDINEKKEVLLMDKKTEEIFTGPGVLKMVGAPGQNIKRPTLDRWRVFVQSTQGTGLIHEGSILLYEKSNLGSGSDTDDLEAVDAERFEILDVKKTCTLLDFVEKTHQLPYTEPRKFYFEFVSAMETITDDLDVILVEKDTNKMFTGLKAKEKIGATAREVTRPYQIEHRYKVFVQNSGGGSRCLNAGTSLLHEV